MPDGQKSICRHCEDKEAELYIKQEFELQELKVDFARLWTQCQRCQGNMQEKVICSNSGMLGIFFAVPDMIFGKKIRYFIFF